jgi:hypothetical protein
MKPVVDIMVDGTGELLFGYGDFNFDASDIQHVRHIVLASPGDFKQYPVLGVGVVKWLNGPIDISGQNKLKSVIGLQLKADGYIKAVVSVGSSLGGVNINAER